MESGRVSTFDLRNIPHMQLFHHLKQKFPDLRDNDVNESIHKYGLDRERCEEELSHRTQVHPGGYYGPWGGRPSPAHSRLTSPVRPSTPTTTMGDYLVYPPGMAPQTPLLGSGGAGSPSPVNSPLGYGWAAGVANGYRPSPQDPHRDIPMSGRDADSPSRSVTPTSAHVVPNSYHPLLMDPPQRPGRRRSAESYPGEARGALGERLEAVRLSPQPAADLPRVPLHPTEPQRDSPPPPTPPPHHTTTPEPPAGLAVTSSPTTTTTSPPPPATTTTTDEGGSSSSRRPPPTSSSGPIREQLARKERLSVELCHQVEEKGRLEAEVEMMTRELHAKEHQRKINADTNTMRIEEVQQENQRLQSECYEMENTILRLAPEFDFETYSTTLTSPFTPEGSPLHPPPPPPPPQLIRGSSGSSLGSDLGTPITPVLTPAYLPTRPAPPPPAPPPPPIPNHAYTHYQGHGGGRGVTAEEEGSHKWGCSKCTFINHPDMNMCEMCDFPRFTIGTTTTTTTVPPPHQGPCYCHRHHHHHSTSPPHHHSGSDSSPSSLPPLPSPKPSLTNMIKDKLLSIRDKRSDSV